MPVSHLGLTVSHIPSATSFYLAALQPLGYRFIGHQGNSIGFGVVSADFFLTQAPIGVRISPNHIAFLAEDRSVVRECYTAALNSGGHPSGSPNYRNQDCTCFNAAVEDLDGNTVEFIFRSPHGDSNCCGEAVSQSEARAIQSREDAEDVEDVEEDVEDDAQSVAHSMRSQTSSKSRAKSTMQTALDLASTTSKSIKSEIPSQGIPRTSTAPAATGFSSSFPSSFPSRTLVGTALGAAAGAALMYAMSRAERANAKDEAAHAAYMNSTKPRSKSQHRQTFEDSRSVAPPLPSLKAQSVARSAAPIAYPAAPAPPSVREPRKSHRNFSTTESAFSTRYPAPQTTQAMRMLEATGHYGEDEEVLEALGRHNSLRAMPTRSRTQDEYVYAPASQTGRSEARSERRSSRTAAAEKSYEPLQYLIEEPDPIKSTISQSYPEREKQPFRSPSHTSSRRGGGDEEDAKHHRNDSGVSVTSHRHHRSSRDSETGRTNNNPTSSSRRESETALRSNLHAPVRRDSALSSPLPAVQKAPSLLIENAAYFPAAISLPASSIASSPHRRSSSGKEKAVPPIHYSEQSWEGFNTAGEESDGFEGDTRTVVPEDSISCVDFEGRRRRRRRRHGEERESESGRKEKESESGRKESESGRKGSESGRSHRKHHHTSSRRSEAASESTAKPIKRGSVVGEGTGRIFGF